MTYSNLLTTLTLALSTAAGTYTLTETEIFNIYTDSMGKIAEIEELNKRQTQDILKTLDETGIGGGKSNDNNSNQ